jgi:predicted chitinase
MSDLRWLAYMLATVYHETAQQMWPIREYGEGKGQPYGEPDENGNCFYGRGFVQLTWKENYDRAGALLALVDNRDPVQHPDIVLDSLIAARVLFRGMSEGWFTGAKLGDYLSETEDDPVNARQIINGNDKDELIAGYHDTFLAALEAAERRVSTA